FYSGLFGWEFENVMPPGSPGEYFIGRIRGLDVAAVGSVPEGAPPMATWNTYVWVDDADETANKVLDAGGTVLMAPFDVMDACRGASPNLAGRPASRTSSPASSPSRPISPTRRRTGA